MLIDSLQPNLSYMKATLLECLKEARSEYKLTISASYNTIMRRERAGVDVYTDTGRDPVNGWRIYTADQIRKIVEYEKKKAESLK